MVNRNKEKGFSLVELMIAVTIVGILAAVAIPQYSKHVQAGVRSDCKEFISRVAQAEEKFYTEFGSYTDILTGAGGCVGEACGLGFTSNQSPRGACTIGLGPIGGSTIERSYLVTGTLLDVNDACLTLTFDSRGRSGNGAGLPDEVCW